MSIRITRYFASGYRESWEQDADTEQSLKARRRRAHRPEDVRTGPGWLEVDYGPGHGEMQRTDRVEWLPEGMSE